MPYCQVAEVWTKHDHLVLCRTLSSVTMSLCQGRTSGTWKAMTTLGRPSICSPINEKLCVQSTRLVYRPGRGRPWIQAQDLHDPSLDKNDITLNSVWTGMEMAVQHLLPPGYCSEGVVVQDHWSGLPTSDKIDQALQKIYEDVSDLLLELLRRIGTSGLFAFCAQKLLTNSAFQA